MRFLGIIALILTLSGIASARSRQAPPLILSPLDPAASRRNVSFYIDEPQTVRTTGRTRETTTSRPVRIGLDIGVLGRYNATNADLFGLKMMWGGRFGARFVIGDGFYLRPSVGYFRRVESAGDASVSQNLFELGAVAQYAFVRLGNITLLGGVAGRGEAQFSRISALNVGDTSSIAFGGRVGPAISANLPINRSTSVVADWEVTFGIERPLRTYSSITAGVLFSLD